MKNVTIGINYENDILSENKLSEFISTVDNCFNLLNNYT
jgi:hypothetical protein